MKIAKKISKQRAIKHATTGVETCSYKFDKSKIEAIERRLAKSKSSGVQRILKSLAELKNMGYPRFVVDLAFANIL